ncbi:MAG: hypothetical protein V4510_10050 [bacterium]
MSLVTLIPRVQGAVASASIVKNILAGLVPRIAGLDAITILAKDIGGFEFDYIGEERLEAGAEITTHYSEDNIFFQDHRALKPVVIVMRGFVSETSFKRTSIINSIRALSSALAPVQPYIGQYSKGTAVKLQEAVTQTDKIINQLAQIASIGGSVVKLIGFFSKTKVQQAYDKLNALRQSGIPFAVVTPWATFGGNNGIDLDGNRLNGPMFIESLVMVSPDETRGWADIIVRLVEIRTAPSLVAASQDNARGSQLPTHNGTVAASGG